MLEHVTTNIRSPRFILALTLSALTAALIAGPLAYQAVNARTEGVTARDTPMTTAADTTISNEGSTSVSTGPGPEPPFTALPSGEEPTTSVPVQTTMPGNGSSTSSTE